jgi:superfamily II DNA or RNA helicase
MSESPPRFSEGQNVRYIGTGKIGTVNKVIKGSRGYQYKITVDGQIRCVSERFLEPITDTEESIVDDFTSGKIGTHEDYKLFQTWLRLSRPIESNLYSYLGSKTLFNSYQFKPLLRFLSPNSEERLFIADEVGVGKTIEAGIIIKELMARDRLDCRSPILIVCPVSLGPKWIGEMKERFGLYFHLHDGDSLKYLLKTVSKENMIPQGYFFSIVGLQLIRRGEYLTLLRDIDSRRSDPLFELVIIDEAHHMRNSETDSHELGNILSSMSEMMLMLSATPLNLRNEDLFSQMHVLNPAAFPDIATFETLQSPVIKLNRISRLLAANEVESRNQILSLLKQLSKDPLGQAIFTHLGVKTFIERLRDPAPFSPEEVARYQRMFISLSPLYYSFTRTRKREALEHQVYREVHELPIVLSLDELEFQNDVLDVIAKHYISQSIDPLALGLVMNIYRRMVSSCIPAMIKYLRWSLKEDKIFNGKGDYLEDLDDDSQLSTSTLDSKLKQEFTTLAEKAKKIESVDSKYSQFKHTVKKILTSPETAQVMVFSFFIKTLEYLKKRLKEDGFSVEVIHGNIPLQSKNGAYGRDQIMDDFKNGKFQILLSSEVGGEGLDFQYCHAIINYDLPYNPMRVEQRIGRIDRFGQKADKIIVVNLFIKGTVDEEIYDRLYRRIRLIEDGIGSLEPILGKELADLQTAIITGTLTEGQKEEMQKRIEERIVSAKLEMEEFERCRKELLSDDYMVTPLNNLSKGDFVSPDDAGRLTELCLSKWEGCCFRKDINGTAEITLSQEIISELEHFLRRPGREGGYNELHPLISHKEPTKVVFDGSMAENLPNRLFLSPTGYWSRFLIDKLEREKAVLKTFSFQLPPNIGIPEGDYLIFFFEVRMEGVKTEIEFLALPVETKGKTVKEIDFNNLPRAIANAKCIDSNLKTPQMNVNDFLHVARDYLDKILEEKRNTVSEDNRYRVNSRIAALRKSTEIKNRKLQQQLDNHIVSRNREGRQPDENYIRLTKARIEKESSRLNSRIEELQKRQVLTLDYNLGAIAYLRVLGWLE